MTKMSDSISLLSRHRVRERALERWSFSIMQMVSIACKLIARENKFPPARFPRVSLRSAVSAKIHKVLAIKVQQLQDNVIWTAITLDVIII